MAAIPLLVLGGFLGAGKTTLLNRLLASPGRERIAVLVNDFGAIAVDSALVTAADAESITLANGCICCSIGSDLMAALLGLLARPDPPDRLVIEASGVADPARIAAIGMAGDAFRLEGIVTVIDAETVIARADDPLVGDTVRRQIAAADLLILNKADLVADTAPVAAWLGRLSTAPVIPAVEAGIAASLLRGLAPSGQPEGGAGDHAAAFASWTFRPAGPLDRGRLGAALDRIGAALWRAKGFVRLVEAPDAFVLVQLVGRRWSLTASPPGPQAEGLVLIGPPGLDGQALLDALGSALS